MYIYVYIGYASWVIFHMPTLCTDPIYFPLIGDVFSWYTEKKKIEKGMQEYSAQVHRKEVAEQNSLI